MVVFSSTLRGAVLLACIVIPTFANPYSFTTVINPTDPNFTQLLGINNSGVIAGYFGDGTVVPNNGFTLVLPNSYTAENFPGSAQTQVVGINNFGETVGFYIDMAGISHGFTFLGGTLFADVSNPSTTTVTQLLGLNDSGEAAGYYTNAVGNFQPFTWVMGTFTPIPVPSLVSAQATGVDNAGDVVGFNMTSASTSVGFLDVGGTFTTLNFPGSIFTQAFGVSYNGKFVSGTYLDSMGGSHGFIYNVATASYQTIDDPFGVGATTVNGINDFGQVVGFYTTGAVVGGVTVTDGFVGSPVPEPKSVILLGTVGLWLAFKLRKRFVL